MTNLNSEKPSANDNGRPATGGQTGNTVQQGGKPGSLVAKPSAASGRLRGVGRGLFVAALTVAAGAFAVSAASAQGPGAGRGAGGEGRGHGFRGGEGGEHGGGHRMGKMLDAAGATDVQKTQIKAIWEGTRPQLKEARQQAHQVRQQIGEALAAPTINAAQIEQLRKQSIQAMDKVSTLMTQAMVQSAQVLNPDQRRKVLDEVRSHQGERGGHGHGRGHGGGFGMGFGGGFGPGPGAGE